MVFKKPYAFFIKYFRLINLFLVMLLSYLGYKLNLLREVINDIYIGSLTNYSALNSQYIGFKMYLLVFIIVLILGSIILLFKRKNKPLKDYLFSVLYVIIVFIYILFISNVFVTLDETIIEQTSLKLYTDISFLVIVPVIYFIFKFILIVIGFNLSKFNFTKDIVELKQDDNDNEEIEVIFNKNTYKYKRGVRKWLRELKYYFLENKFLISIILIVVVSILGITFFSFNIFNSNKVNMKENFVAGTFNYKVMEVSETKYNLNYRSIKDGSKFVIARVIVKNIGVESSSIDFKRIRLLYGDEYVYANNYFNDNFLDLGKPYNNEVLKSNVLNEYIFIFEVPETYKARRYTLKFYDRLTVSNEETFGSYKEIKIKTEKLDEERTEKTLSLKENTIFNRSNYGESNLTINSYELKNNYIYEKDGKTNIVRDKDINKILLILDYKLSLDKNETISSYFGDDKEFFDKFVSVEYTYNGKDKVYDANVVGNADNKIMLSIPFEVQNSTNVKVILNFRKVKIIYKLN